MVSSFGEFMHLSIEAQFLKFSLDLDLKESLVSCGFWLKHSCAHLSSSMALFDPSEDPLKELCEYAMFLAKEIRLNKERKNLIIHRTACHVTVS